MGDSRRFDLFSKIISNNFPNKYYKNVADIAGGKGYLNKALKDKGYYVTTYDVRKKINQNINYKRTLFTEKVKTKYDLLVAMHPDEATDVTISMAAKLSIPFVICPCCVKPTVTVMFEKHTYKNWIKHLKKFAEQNGFHVTETHLPMNGKNIVLVGRRNK